jgi:hypothetical protein
MKMAACVRCCEMLLLRAAIASRADTCASGGHFVAAVDIYNATSNSWIYLPAGLGQIRYRLAAASLPSGLVLFAGGVTPGA